MKDITLVTIEPLYHGLAKVGLEQTLKHIDVKEVVTFSDKDVLDGARNILISPKTTFQEYQMIMLKGMLEHVNTEHIIFQQWDAMAYDGTKWTDEFLNFDYIGAVWPWEPEGRNVGNGGFSLRSRRLMEATADQRITLIDNEDAVFCKHHRALLENEFGVKFAPTQLARQFSHEIAEGTFQYTEGFGFHGQWNVVKLAPLDIVEYFITNMDYKGWNVYKWHHFLYAIVERELFEHMPFVIQQLTTHSPELFGQLISWLRNEQSFWEQF